MHGKSCLILSGDSDIYLHASLLHDFKPKNRLEITFTLRSLEMLISADRL